MSYLKLDPMQGMPRDLAALDTSIYALRAAWKGDTVPAVERDWPGLAAAIAHVLGNPSLVEMLS